MIEYIEPRDLDDLTYRLGFHYRDRGLALSALGAPMPVFGTEVYVTIHEKATVLLEAINGNHPLLDGNKRLSWLVVAAFYAINGWDLAAPPHEINTFVRAVAAGTLSSGEIRTWLTAHVTPMSDPSAKLQSK